jgi:hypothetical protein
MASLRSFIETTNLRTILISLLLFLFGIGLLISSETIEVISKRAWGKAVVANLGGLVVAAISIALLWELISKRAFLDELLAKAGLAEDVRTLGLTGLTVNPLTGPAFPKLIRTTKRLDIFVCYANTWRTTHEQDLRVLSRSEGIRVRFFVPNPDNVQLMTELAHRFGAASAAVLADKVRVAISEMKDIFRNREFYVWVHEENPVTSFYLFDDTAVVTLYKHARGRGSVPTFVAERGGTLFNYVQDEVDAMVKGLETHGPLARQIFPSLTETLSGSVLASCR